MTGDLHQTVAWPTQTRLIRLECFFVGGGVQIMSGLDSAPYGLTSPNDEPAEVVSDSESPVKVPDIQKSEKKVTITFKSVGNAPLLKSKVSKVNTQPATTIAKIREYLLKMLAPGGVADETLFLFINSSFQPTPDATVGSLSRCFSDGESLVIQYALVVAWG